MLHRHSEWAPSGVGPRHVEVWCPPSYAADPNLRMPVIYAQDGQNLFPPGAANGWGHWGVAAAMEQVCAAYGIAGAIVVGVWHPPQRWQEYMPARPLLHPAAHELAERFVAEHGTPVSDQYLRYLVEELKPQVDATYRTLPEREHTFLMGSSMGGLISFYGLCEYPSVFGGAACLSTHWSAGGAVLVDAMAALLPPAGAHRLYFDYGSLGLDAAYELLQQRMDAHLHAAGYQPGHDWLSLSFVGADHNEAAWRARLHEPLAFLLTHGSA
ncbi:MAG: alpha/beta hydrolase [Oscillochloridaceae bacterium umkhey_bin13]